MQFASFLMAGFECNSALVDRGRRLDLLKSTRHDKRVREDYRLLAGVGIRTVREGFSWHGIDTAQGDYDFSRYIPMLEAGKHMGIQQIWDLNHFDYPDKLNPFSPAFVSRFAHYALAAVRFLRSYSTDTLYLVPMNEISFATWIGADKGWWYPYKTNKGTAFKKQLVKATLAGMRAIWAEDAKVRFIHVDPFMRRIALIAGDRQAEKAAHEFNTRARFEAWDMIAGKVYPELGGSPKYLDIVGMNYYIHNQEWVYSNPITGVLEYKTIPWNHVDRISFADMITEVYTRYKRPILISETGSYGNLRYRWWSRVLEEVDVALARTLPVLGVCAYPVLDRPRGAGYLLPKSGLWDFKPGDRTFTRIPHRRTIALLKSYIKKHSP